MVLAFLVEFYYVLHHVIFAPTCDTMGEMVGQQGKAWACGLARFFDIFTLPVLLSIPCYFIFIVFSYCEDMAEGGAGPDLSDLKAGLHKRRRAKQGIHDPYSSVLGLSGWMKGEYGTVYDEKVGNVLAGGQAIGALVGGDYHELDYPPVSNP